ncbi:reverse transcriptase [Tanacetum coccineum]|uniref:Reverse transcriptase n=1 Tax=Tanacetum coccineum TaxID=301880 RepID=A0ABQ4XTC9_9ASTR
MPLPKMDKEGLIEVQPMKLLDKKLVKKKNDVAVYGLIQWTNGDVQDATWELLEELCKRFPGFDLDS